MLRTGPQEALEAGAGVTSFCARLHAPTQPQRLALSPHSWAVWRHTSCVLVPLRRRRGARRDLVAVPCRENGGDADGTDRDSSWPCSVPSAWNCLQLLLCYRPHFIDDQTETPAIK